MITFYSGEDVPVFLIDVFSKGKKSDLTPSQRNALKKVGKDIVEGYRGRVTKLRRP